MPKKEYVDFEVDIVMFTEQNVLTASTFNANDYDDDQWLGFEKWGV